MSPRQLLRVDSLIQMILVIFIWVGINTFSVDHFSRLDLTEDRIHTLSQAGRQLMGKVEKPLVVKVFFTGGLETPYNNHEQILVDKLREFQAWSGGQLELTVQDPTGDEELQAEAQRLGIQPIQYRFKSSQRAELRQVYMGAALFYGDQQQVMPAITNVDTVEYDLARAIKILLDGGERKTIGYTTGHGEPDLATAGGPVQTLRAKLQESYDLVPMTLGGAGAIPEEVDAVWIVGPQSELGLREQYQLDQFLMSGRPVAAFLRNTLPDIRRNRASPVYHGLEAWLGHHGVRVNRDVVVDRVQNGVMRFPVRQGQFQVMAPVNYPLIPKVTELSTDNPTVNGLDQMLFPFASSIELADETEDLSYEVLATASEEAGRIRNIKVVHPQHYTVRDPSEEVGPWQVAVSARGTFRSFFSGREIPQPALVADDAEPDAPLIVESAPTRLVVVGSADMIANNTGFMLNLADWMVQDEALISIRTKSVQVPPLESLEGEKLLAVKLLNLVGPALLLVLLGAFRFGVRRRVEQAPRRSAA